MTSRRAAACAVLIVLGTAAVRAQVREPAPDVEEPVRAAAGHYVTGMLLGDASVHLKAARLPLTVVRDGVPTQRDEKQVRDQLAQISARIRLSEADRTQVAENLQALVDNADIQFVGANTATLAVVTRPARKADDGVGITLLVLHRSQGLWKVAVEVTDPAPVPPAYVLPSKPPQPN